MAITPQAIKDQEFQVKFRGYDTIEVKAYLELIADDFFELFEQVGQQADDIEALLEEKEDLNERHALLESDMETLQRKYDKMAVDLGEANERNTSLQTEIEDLTIQIADLEREGKEKEENLDVASELLDEGRKEKEAINLQLKALEKQLEEQQKDEIDFKDTLLAGQKFSREMKKKSEEEAEQLLEMARAETEQLRQETFQELARYPEEIKQLKKKRDRIRDELRAVLTQCLENLDVINTVQIDEEDCSDLFQRVVVADDGTVLGNEPAKFGIEHDISISFHADPDLETEGVDDIDDLDVA